MCYRITSFILISITLMLIAGCASSPEELAREAENLKNIQNLQGNWRTTNIKWLPESSQHYRDYHYEFKLNKTTMIVYFVRDKDEGLALKGDRYEYLRFTMDGRRLKGVKELERKVDVQGVVNEDFNEIFWTWEIPDATDGNGNQSYREETIRRE